MLQNIFTNLIKKGCIVNKLIVSNQKIYFKNRKEFREYAETLKKEIRDIKSEKVKICVLPDFLNIPQASDIFKDTGIYFGAQDVFWEDAGPYTGAISPLVL